MAIYHLSTKPISRSSGRTATASIAYRAGIEIKDDRTGKTHDYTRRGGVLGTQLHTPNNIPISRAELWNLAETTETRKNSRTAREIVVNLPHELPPADRNQLVNDFAKSLADKYGVAVDVALHSPDKEGDNRNYHAHIMLTTRKLERLESGRIALTDKAQLEMSNTQLKDKGLPSAKDELKAVRKQWADMTNKRLERAGLEQRIDHRSHADRGLEQLPTKKLGWEATALERKGIATETGDYNRAVKAFNQTINQVKAIDKDIEQAQELQRQRKEAVRQFKLEARKHALEREIPPKATQQTPPPVKERTEQKKPPVISGQTVKEAQEVYSEYNQLVAITSEKMREHYTKQAGDKMAGLAKQYKELESNMPLLFKGKHKEKMQEIAREYKEAKENKKYYQDKDYSMDAKGYIEKKYPEAHAKLKEAQQTLTYQASIKHGSKEAQAGRQYTGEITAVNRFGVLQRTPTGRKIYHDLESFKGQLPHEGDQVTVSYDSDKNAELITADKVELERQREQYLEQQKEQNNERGFER